MMKVIERVPIYNSNGKGDYQYQTHIYKEGVGRIPERHSIYQMNITNKVKCITRVEPPKIPLVDDWEIGDDDYKINHCKGSILMPISAIYGTVNPMLDRFDLSAKRGYDNDKIRTHYVHYINYFLKYFDKDCELLMIYSRLKYMIDIVPEYSESSFLTDIDNYILRNPSLRYKLSLMNIHNYKKLNTNFDENKNKNLQYNDKHAMILMEISLLINILIPLLPHFAHIKRINSIQDFLLKVYDRIFDLYDVDIYSKLYETCSSNINRNEGKNPLWKNQDIRGINTTTHTISSVQNIIINIIPKYVYNQNLVILNYAGVKNNIRYQVIDIGYEYDYMTLMSSKRDEDQNSEFDKFEATLSKQDESLFLQNQVNCEETMKLLTQKFNVTQDDVDFYLKELSKNDPNNIIIGFQKDLIFNIFYKYFGDVVSIKAINKEDYIKLMIIAKKILRSVDMKVLPYIISGRIVRLAPRKGLNKRELIKLKNSPSYYENILNNYKSEKIEKYILSIIGTVLSSDFEIIDIDPELNGKRIDTSVINEVICEEMRQYINLIVS